MASVWKSEDAEVRRSGPSLKVQVTLPKLPVGGLEVREPAPPVSALGLIDTGAGHSCIDESIAKRLNLTPRDQREVLTASGSAMQYLYDVCLKLDEIGSIDLVVFGSDLGQQAHHVLLGRDVLQYGTLIYSGRSSSFEFCV